MGDNCDRSPRRRGHNVSHHARVEQTEFLLRLTLHWPAPATWQVPLPPRPLRLSSFCSSSDAGPHTTTARYSRRTARACGCGSVPTGRRSACRLRNGLREPKAACSCPGAAAAQIARSLRGCGSRHACGAWISQAVASLYGEEPSFPSADPRPVEAGPRCQGADRVAWLRFSSQEGRPSVSSEVR